jgi:O-antigen/teichoic acid export membrane protein/O-antigen ligase
MAQTVSPNLPPADGAVPIIQSRPITERLRWPRPALPQVVLGIAFGILLLLVILGCAASPSPFIPVVLLAALAVMALAAMRPRIALLLVFTGAGLPSLLLPLPGHNMRPVEIGLLLCLLAIAVRPAPIRLRLPHLLALLFGAIAIVSFIHVPEITTAVNDFGADKRLYGLLLMILALFCGAFLVDHVKDVSSFLVMILLTNIPLYLIGLAQALGMQVPPLLETSGAQNLITSQGRLWGPYTGPATFGLYLMNLLAVALACWLLGTRRRDRMIGALMTIATTLEIIGSGTRSVAIAVVVMLVATCVLTRRFKLFLGLAAMAGGALLLFWPKILPLFAHSDYSTSDRIFLWNEALKLITTHPWIGIGLSQFRFYYAHLIVSDAARLNADAISVHNQYLELAMESGIPWLIVGVLLLASIVFSCWRAYRRAQRAQQAMLLAAILAMLANITTGCFDVPLDKTEGTVFLFLLAGLALGIVERMRCSAPFPLSTAVALPDNAEGNPLPASPLPLLIKERGRGIRSAIPKSDSIRPQREADGERSSPPVDIPAITGPVPTVQGAGRAIVIQLLSWSVTIPASLVMTVLLARYLGPTQYGEYSFTLPFLAVFALLSGIGMDPLIIRQLSRQPRSEWRHTLSYAAGTRLLSTILSAMLAIIVAWLLPVTTEQRSLLLLGSISLLFCYQFSGFRMIYDYGFRAEQRVSIPALLEAADRLATTGLVVIIILLHLSLLWAYFLITYSDIPFFLILAFISRRRFGVRVRFSLVRARDQVLSGLPLLGYSALVLVAWRADLFLLMALAGPLSVGIYALALRITEPLLSIVLAYVTGLYPLLCARFAQGRTQLAAVYRQAVRLLALVFIPLAMLVSIRAHPIILLLGGQDFAAAAIAVQLLMWATALAAYSQLAARTCMAADLERRIPLVTGISASINVLANVMLIPHWQVLGAAMATLLSESVELGLYSALLIHQVRLFPPLGILMRVFAGNLPALAFLLWQQQMPLPLTIPVVLALTTAGCAATRTLTLSDVTTVWHMFHTRHDRQPATPEDIANWPTVILPKIQG